MQVKLSPRTRTAIYVSGVLGTPVVAYLFLKGYIGKEEVGLWASLQTAAFGLAALNVKGK